MVGGDIRNMSDITKSILMNKDLISIDQDALGKQAIRMMRKDGLEVWKKPLTNDRFAIALFNRNSEGRPLAVAFKDIEMDSTAKFDVYDVWKHAPAGTAMQSISSILQPHECQVFILTPAKK